MGPGIPSVISNASPFPVKLLLQQNETRVTKWEKGWSIGAKVEGTVGGSASVDVSANADDGKSEEGKTSKKTSGTKVSGSVKKEVTASVEGSYKNVEEGTVVYVDSDLSGFRMISPMTSVDVSATAGTGANYVTILVEIDKNVHCALMKNYKINGCVRLCVGYNNEGMASKTFCPEKHLEVVQLAAHPKTWRCIGGTQNYYFRYTCNTCFQTISCKKGCLEAKEYKGHIEDTW